MRTAGGIAVLVSLWGALEAAAQTAPEWTKFDFARERLGHKVIVDATLANNTGADLADVRVVAIYFSDALELRRSTAVEVARLAAGRAASFKIEAEQVPNFNRCEVVVEASGRKWIYAISESGRMPEIRKASRPQLVVVSYRDAAPGAFPGATKVTVVVRNTGESEAQEPTALASFLDAAGAVVHQARVRLAPAVKGLAEDTFEISVPGVPAYSSAGIGVAWMAGQIPMPPEPPPDAAELNIRRLRIVRLTDGTAHVSGAVHNGLPGAVDKVKITFRLGKKSHPLDVPGPIASGASRPFDFYVPNCPPFEDGAYSLAFSETQSTQPPPAPEPGPVARRTGSRDTSVDAPFVPTKDAGDLKPAPPEEAKPDPKDPQITVAIRGAYVIEGFDLRGLKTGDVVYLRLAFRDGQGNPVQPSASLKALVYIGGQPFKRVPRNITSASYKLDAGKVTPQNANHEAVLYDSRTSEVWVGLVRTSGRAGGLGLDVSLTISRVGTWTWKGLDDKLEAAARGPDPKK